MVVPQGGARTFHGHGWAPVYPSIVLLGNGIWQRAASLPGHFVCGFLGELQRLALFLLLETGRNLAGRLLDLAQFFECYRTLTSLAPVLQCLRHLW